MAEDKITKSNIQPLSGALMRGAGWTVAMRLMSKFLGIISLAICARILLPADYGLVSMAMVVIGLSNVLVDFGLETSLIRHPNATPAHYDTAWSLKIVQATLLAGVVLIAAPIAAHFYQDERILPIMIAIGVASWIGGLQNIYTVKFRKQLNFRGDFISIFVPRFISFVATVVCVLILQTYWGLVIGICVGEIARMVVSYFIVPERARWSLSHWRELTGFSFWYFMNGLAEFVTYQLDRLFIGILGGAHQVGLYALGREVASLPSTEMVVPIGRALVPTLAKLNDDPARQARAAEKALGGVVLISVPMAIGFALIASELVLLLFGDKWHGAIPLVMAFSLVAVTSGFRSTAMNILVVMGKVRINAIFSWIQGGLAVALLYPAYLMGGLLGVIGLFGLIGFLFMIVLGVCLHRFKMLNGWHISVELTRIFIAAGLMYLAVTLVAPHLPTLLIFSLTAKAILGAVVYTGVLLALWWVMGCPDSSERLILNLLKERWHQAVVKRQARNVN